MAAHGVYAVTGLFAIIGVALAGFLAWRKRRTSMSHGCVFGLACLLFAAPALIAAALPPWDDESFRLIAIQSLIEDGDLNLADEFRERRWLEFKPVTGSYFEALADGIQEDLLRHPELRFYSSYGPLDIVLGSPGFFAARIMAPGRPWLLRLGARLSAWLAAAGVVMLLYHLLLKSRSSPGWSLAVSSAIALSPTIFFLGIRLWPEIYAAFFLMVIATMTFSNITLTRACLLGLVISALPVLHVRYIPLAAAVGLAVFFFCDNWKARFCLLVSMVPAAIAGLAYLSQLKDPNTMEVYRAIHYPAPWVRGESAFTLSNFSLHTLWMRVVAPPAGFVLYAPVLMLIPLVRGAPRRVGILTALSATATFLIIMLSVQDSGPVGRYWTAIVPLAALSLAGPGIARFRKLFLGLTLYGAVRAVVFASVPVLAMDSLTAGNLSEGLGLISRIIIHLLIA